MDLWFPHNFPGNRNMINSDDLSKTTTSSAFKKYMRRMSFSRPFRYWLRDSGYMIRLNQATQMQGGSAICIHKDLLPGDAVVTHVVTCQGRDHVVNVRSGCQSLFVVNVHFEPELTLRSLRERLRLITPHWPQYPDATGTIMGDFNICEPEEGMFNVWNQTFTDGDTVKAAIMRLQHDNHLEMSSVHCFLDHSIVHSNLICIARPRLSSTCVVFLGDAVHFFAVSFCPSKLLLSLTVSCIFEKSVKNANTLYS